MCFYSGQGWPGADSVLLTRGLSGETARTNTPRASEGCIRGRERRDLSTGLPPIPHLPSVKFHPRGSHPCPHPQTSRLYHSHPCLRNQIPHLVQWCFLQLQSGIGGAEREREKEEKKGGRRGEEGKGGEKQGREPLQLRTSEKEHSLPASTIGSTYTTFSFPGTG